MFKSMLERYGVTELAFLRSASSPKLESLHISSLVPSADDLRSTLPTKGTPLSTVVDENEVTLSRGVHQNSLSCYASGIMTISCLHGTKFTFDGARCSHSTLFWGHPGLLCLLIADAKSFCYCRWTTFMPNIAHGGDMPYTLYEHLILQQLFFLHFT